MYKHKTTKLILKCNKTFHTLKIVIVFRSISLRENTFLLKQGELSLLYRSTFYFPIFVVENVLSCYFIKSVYNIDINFKVISFVN